MLLRMHKRPEQMSATIALFFANAMPYFVFLYGFANWYWVRWLRGENEVGEISVWTSLAYVILPIRTLLDKCSEDTSRDDKITYDMSKAVFPTDYDRQNPVTKKDANIQYLKDLEKMSEGDETEKTQIQEALKNALQDNKFNALRNYGQTNLNINQRSNLAYNNQPLFQAAPGFAPAAGGGGLFGGMVG